MSSLERSSSTYYSAVYQHPDGRRFPARIEVSRDDEGWKAWIFSMFHPKRGAEYISLSSAPDRSTLLRRVGDVVTDIRDMIEL